MSFGRTEKDDEIAAIIDQVNANKDTNWRELFDLPLDTKNTNSLLNKFYGFVESPDAETGNTYKNIFDAVKAALRNPVKLREVISQSQLAFNFPVMFRRRATFTTYYHVESLLDLLTSYDCPAESMRMLLELIPQQLLPFTNMAMHLVRYPEKLDIYLSMLSDQGRKLLLNVRADGRNTILHAAASYPDTFKKLLAMANDDELRMNALLATNDNGVMVLHEAAENDESFDIAFSLIPDVLKRRAAEVKSNNGKQLIHFANTRNNMHKILQVYAPEERLALLTTKPAYGLPAIAMACANLNWLDQIIHESLPYKDMEKAMSATGERGRDLLQSLQSDPANMTRILGQYPEDERLHAIQPMRLLAYTPYNIIAVMHNLPLTKRERPEETISEVNDRIQFLESSEFGKQSFLVEYAKRNYHGCRNVLDATIQRYDDRLKAIYLSGNSGDDFIEIAEKNDPDYAQDLKEGLKKLKDTLTMESDLITYLDKPEAAESSPKKLRENSSQAMTGMFGGTARYGEIPKNIPSTLTIAEYKELQKLHDELQFEARRLAEITRVEYWDYAAGYQESNTLDKLEKLRSILKCHEGVMKKHGIEPVHVDPYTKLYRPW